MITVRLADVARRIGGTVEGDGETPIHAVLPLDSAGEGALTFLANPRYHAQLQTTRASAALVQPGVDCPEGVIPVRVENPYGALPLVLALFDPGPPGAGGGVHPSAVIDPSAAVAEGASVGPLAVVGPRVVVGAGSTIGARATVEEDSVLGRDCFLYPGSYVGRGSRLGDRVVLQAGAVVGSDGFGYARVEGVYHKIPQIGVVVLEDDVEIGANACIDRATLGETRIGRGTKIDNLVQIGHNAALGEHSAIAALSGVAGSSRIGNRFQMGGQSGANGHIRIGDDVVLAANSVIWSDTPDGVMISGVPARPHRERLKADAALRQLPALVKRVRELEKRDRQS